MLRDSRGRFAKTGAGYDPRTGYYREPRPIHPLTRVETRTAVAFVIDESGSMSHLSRILPNEFRTLLNEIPRGNPIAVFPFNANVKGPFPDLTWYNPSGGTALWDAIDAAITHLEAQRMPSLLWVLTDGHENASRNVSSLTLQNRILRNSGWLTVAFAGPSGLTGAVRRGLGLEVGNVTEWENTEVGTHDLIGRTVGSTQTYFAARARGETMTKSFYSNVQATPEQVAASLVNVAPQFVQWDVTAECEIRPFVEAHGRVYTPGAAFYQLTKPEKVQTYKEILVKDKFKARIYAGREARNLLGLPYHEDIKVIPGNHGNFDIFVQSNSVNRKLVRGTKVLYRK